MTSKVTSFLTYALGAQILLGVIAICAVLNGWSLEGYIEIWGVGKVVAAIISLELAGVGIVYLMKKDSNRIGDERDDLIDLKSYRISFHIQTIAFLGLLLGNSLMPAKSPVFVVVTVIVIAAISRIAAWSYFRKVN